MAARFPAVDGAPMSSLGGQISPPGSRHKPGGRRALACPLQDARAAVEQPNGPEVWNALLTEFAAELRHGSGAADPGVAELDDTGVPWLPRLGGGAPLTVIIRPSPAANPRQLNGRAHQNQAPTRPAEADRTKALDLFPTDR